MLENVCVHFYWRTLRKKWHILVLDVDCITYREEVSARRTWFLPDGEATSPLEPRRRRHLNMVLGFRKCVIWGCGHGRNENFGCFVKSLDGRWNLLGSRVRCCLADIFYILDRIHQQCGQTNCYIWKCVIWGCGHGRNDNFGCFVKNLDGYNMFELHTQCAIC